MSLPDYLWWGTVATAYTALIYVAAPFVFWGCVSFALVCLLAAGVQGAFNER